MGTFASTNSAVESTSEKNSQGERKLNRQAATPTLTLAARIHERKMAVAAAKEVHLQNIKEREEEHRLARKAASSSCDQPNRNPLLPPSTTATAATITSRSFSGGLTPSSSTANVMPADGCSALRNDTPSFSATAGGAAALPLLNGNSSRKASTKNAEDHRSSRASNTRNGGDERRSASTSVRSRTARKKSSVGSGGGEGASPHLLRFMNSPRSDDAFDDDDDDEGGNDDDNEFPSFNAYEALYFTTKLIAVTYTYPPVAANASSVVAAADATVGSGSCLIPVLAKTASTSLSLICPTHAETAADGSAQQRADSPHAKPLGACIPPPPPPLPTSGGVHDAFKPLRFPEIVRAHRMQVKAANEAVRTLALYAQGPLNSSAMISHSNTTNGTVPYRPLAVNVVASSYPNNNNNNANTSFNTNKNSASNINVETVTSCCVLSVDSGDVASSNNNEQTNNSKADEVMKTHAAVANRLLERTSPTRIIRIPAGPPLPHANPHDPITPLIVTSHATGAAVNTPSGANTSGAAAVAVGAPAFARSVSSLQFMPLLESNNHLNTTIDECGGGGGGNGASALLSTTAAEAYGQELLALGRHADEGSEVVAIGGGRRGGGTSAKGATAAAGTTRGIGFRNRAQNNYSFLNSNNNSTRTATASLRAASNASDDGNGGPPSSIAAPFSRSASMSPPPPPPPLQRPQQQQQQDVGNNNNQTSTSNLNATSSSHTGMAGDEATRLFYASVHRVHSSNAALLNSSRDTSRADLGGEGTAVGGGGGRSAAQRSLNAFTPRTVTLIVDDYCDDDDGDEGSPRALSPPLAMRATSPRRSGSNNLASPPENVSMVVNDRETTMYTKDTFQQSSPPPPKVMIAHAPEAAMNEIVQSRNITSDQTAAKRVDRNVREELKVESLSSSASEASFASNSKR